MDRNAGQRQPDMLLPGAGERPDKQCAKRCPDKSKRDAAKQGQPVNSNQSNYNGE
ncbi:hypothetical protein D3C84_1285140 [compost metagenome]